MATVPLHPAFVHVPLALAVLAPIAAAVAVWLIARRRAGSGAWAAVVATQAVLVVSALVALRTGRAEEERVEDRVREAAVEQHEEAAEGFLVVSGVVLLVSAAGLIGPAAARRWTMLAATAGTVVVASLAVRTGKAGGELVYVHGAAGQASALADANDRGERTGGDQDGDRDDR